MHPRLFELPAYLFALFGGTLLGLILFSGIKRVLLCVAAAIGLGLAAAFVVHSRWGTSQIPVHTYGIFILVGFLFGVWMAARRSELIGVAKTH